MKSFAMKMLTVCSVGLLLLIAGVMLQSVVRDRLANRDVAISSITESLAGEQTISGVSLVIDYIEHYREEVRNRKTGLTHFEAQSSSSSLELLPDKLDVTGKLGIDERHRGLFRVIGYVLDGRVTGNFILPAAKTLRRAAADSRLEFTSARMVFAVSDPRGIRKLEMKLKDTQWAIDANAAGPLTSKPQAAVEAVAWDVNPRATGSRAGAEASIDNVGELLGQNVPFDIKLELVGTNSLSLVPLGRESTATVTSSWRHPSFGGRFLPTQHSENAQGFDARWRVSALASNARAAWLGKAASEQERMDSFSVSLIDPVDIYVMSDRAGKYAGLFIAITLGSFLLFELLRSLRLHPLHYLLIGAALLIFFLLLLALSERLGFGLAYTVAASACVLLIGIYSVNLLRSKGLALGFTVGLGSLYGALYVILLSEQNALLMGSLLIFALLGAVMLGTRKVDWHALLAERPAFGKEDEVTVVKV
ncbi:MAG TPA: cell envelope integrity protein CreD [Rhodocyclaceae bacterium]|nr:cell envelope integrity protein CreD [Rhodocyclaceae bacterium]